MPKTLRYIGAEERFFEVGVTGSQQMWLRNQIGEVSNSDSVLLLATGKFAHADTSPALINRSRMGAAIDPVTGGSIPLGKSSIRLANKAVREAMNRATLWATGQTIVQTDVRRLSTGQLIIAGTGGTTGASEPAFSSTAAMADNTVTWWPLNETSQAAPAGITTATFADNLGISGKTVVYNILANPSLFARPSAPNLNYVNGSGNTTRANSWAVVESPSQDNGFGSNGRQGKWATYEFVTASPNIDIGYMSIITGAVNERLSIWIDGRPLSEAPIAMGNPIGQNRFVSVALSGPARKRNIRIGTFGPNLLSYVALDNGFTVEAPPRRDLTMFWASDSFGDTESPSVSSANYDTAIKVSQALGFPHVINVGIGGTSYSRDNGSRYSYRKVLANNDLTALAPDVAFIGHGFNAPNNAVNQSTEVAAALECWALTRADLLLAPIIVCGTWYRVPAFTAGHDSLQEALKAAFLSWADPNSAFIDPHDGSVTLGDGSVVLQPSSAWFNSANVSWALPPTGGGFDGFHPSPAGRAYVLVPKVVEACEAALTALG